MNWISVKDRFPELYIKVLMQGAGIVDIGYWDGECWRTWHDSRKVTLIRITHWLDIPPTP